jgi:hypothetical protein
LIFCGSFADGRFMSGESMPARARRRPAYRVEDNSKTRKTARLAGCDFFEDNLNDP